jgi:cyanate permease
VNEFRRGWPTLLGSFIGIAAGVSSTYFYSLGIFLKPVGATFGWTRGEASLGPLVGTLAAAIAAPMTGRVIDRAGPVIMAVVSMLVLATGFALLGSVTAGLTSFLLIIGIMSLLNVGSSPMSYSRLLVADFDRHRGIALGVALTGTGLGAALLPAFLVPYIAAHGWRAGYHQLALGVAVACIPVMLLFIGHLRVTRGGQRQPIGAVRPTRPLQAPIAVWRDPLFRLLGTIFFLAAIAVLGTVVHFVPLLMDAGIDAVRAGRLAGLIGLSVIGGRVVAGLLLDRVPAQWITAGLFLGAAAGMLGLAIGGTGAAVPGACAVGLGVGAEVDLIAYLVSRHFSPTRFGAYYGGVYGAFLLGGAVGPALIGFLFDVSGSYAVPLAVSATLLGGAGFLALRIPSARPAAHPLGDPV